MTGEAGEDGRAASPALRYLSTSQLLYERQTSVLLDPLRLRLLVTVSEPIPIYLSSYNVLPAF